MINVTLGFTQEICDNGIDDDLDGFVDCYDRDCPDSPACEDFFISEDPSCEATPTQFPTFSIKMAWASENRTATNNSLSSIGDVDGDGIPEVISTNSEDRTVFVLNGIDGSIESQITIANQPFLEVMHADIDRDGCAEIFVPTQSSFGITALDCNLSTVLWTASTIGRPGNIGVADFDEDGLAEIYARDEIFDAHTGVKMRASDFNNTATSANYIERHISNNGIAVDILDDSECADCAGLEYVVGGRIYSVSINRGTMTATMTLERSIDHFPVYYAPWQQNRSGTSVADYNLDGHLDVLSVGITSTDTRTQLFFWDVFNNTVSIYFDPLYNWTRGTGRINIADIDGDGQLNATYVTGQYLYALDENWQQLWRSTITESSSGTTGTTVFDFNGDGTFETVYRDESFLYIVDGTNGTFFQSIPCRSLTYTEYPIVADLDGDGSTEICVSCLTNNGGSIWDIGNAQIRVFESNGEQWVTARKIWNQHGYFNVNINDNGTVPVEMQKHHLVFSSGVCSTGGDVMPLNTFLNQAPYITSDGCANYSAPDVNFAGNVSFNAPQCPETNFSVSFDVSNTGDREVSASVPITFYDGDPALPGAVKLNTVSQLLFIGIGQTVTVSDLTVIGPGGDFDLYISVNDDGSQNPPITFPAGGIVECDFGNNIGTLPATSLPFSISVQKISDNNKCDPLAPDNGSASASTSGFSSIYFEDFEDLAIGSTSDVGSSAWTRTNASADWAEVRNDNGDREFGARDTDGEVVWRSETLDITNFTTVQGSMVLKSVSTGGDVFESADYIRAYYSIDGGVEIPLTNGDFTGAVGPTIAGTGSDSEVATFSGIAGNTLEIIVRMANSADQERYYIDDIDIEGFGTVTAGYTFNWFFGGSVSGPPDFVGSTHTGMAEGLWTIYSTHTATGCGSDTVQVTINLTSQNPAVDVSVINAYSNCHSPDGQLLAVVNGGAPEIDFDFEWYEGLDIFTSPVIGINALATNLDPTTYTVVVTEKVSSCQTIRSGTVPADASFPVVNPRVDQDVTNCINDDGAVSATVSGAGIAWLEDFQDLANGTSIDNGSTAWSRAPAPGGSGRADVRNVNGSKVFEVRNSGGNQIVFTTENIDISSMTSVELSVNLSASSHMEVSTDYLRVYYQIDGGPEIPLDSGLQAGSFGNIEAIATGLSGSTVRIVAKFRNTANNERYQIDNISVSGIGEFISGYDFDWYIGDVIKPSPDFTGSSFTDLPAGNYTVTATSLATGCTSSPVTVTVGSLVSDPVITTTVLAPQTSCDPANPNGSASANVGGTTDGHTFNWFAGQNTNPVNEIAGSPNPTVNTLVSGIYTVLVTVDSTGCFSTEEITISENIVDPVVTAAVDADQTICTPGAFDGQVSATVGGVTAGYTFYWFDGNIGAPDINNPDFTGDIYSGLAAGDYTVVAADNALTCVSAP
ncbi:MAG: VCBS repeat-containing protein, partial [Cyclobacteriaceae bacterium]|nr:VCBS repeat-containing protein [Cyclobacteriaceae bacterium]